MKNIPSQAFRVLKNYGKYGKLFIIFFHCCRCFIFVLNSNFITHETHEYEHIRQFFVIN